MGDWDEFGDESEIIDTTESLDSLDDSSYESFVDVDVFSTLDSVESIEDNIEFPDTPPETLSIDYVDSVMDSVEVIPVEFEETDADMVLNRDEAKLWQEGTNGIKSDGIGEIQSEIVENTEEAAEVRSIDEVGTWLEEINPNFDPFDIDSPYCNNCGSCAYAVYQRLEGNKDICATAENIGYNNEMENLTGMEQISMSPEEIETRLLEAGDGAHAIIGIDRAFGAGHWFNAANIGGKVVAIDGQSGEINDWPPDYGNVVNWEMSVKKENV